MNIKKYVLALIAPFILMGCSSGLPASSLPNADDIANATKEVAKGKQKVRVAIATAETAIVLLDTGSAEVKNFTKSDPQFIAELDLQLNTAKDVLEEAKAGLKDASKAPTTERLRQGLRAAKNVVGLLETAGFDVHPIVYRSLELCEEVVAEAEVK